MNTSEEQIRINEVVKELLNIRGGIINLGHLQIDQVSEIINYAAANWHISTNILCFVEAEWVKVLCDPWPGHVLGLWVQIPLGYGCSVYPYKAIN